MVQAQQTRTMETQGSIMILHVLVVCYLALALQVFWTKWYLSNVFIVMICSPLANPLVIVNMLTLTTAGYPSWQFIQLNCRTFIYPKAPKDSYVFVSGWHCLYAWCFATLFVALWLSESVFDLGDGGLERMGHYEDTRKYVRRGFGTPVSCWGTKSWLQRLYVPVHAFQ